MITSITVISYVMTFVAGFGVGSTVGWYVSSRSEQISERAFRRSVAAIIITMWTFAVGADVLITSYDAPVLLHGIMGAVTGFLFSEDGLDIQIGGQ